MTEDVKRTCTTCKWCLRRDHGYSNYTTEGTELHCLLGKNAALEGREDETWRDLTPELAAALDVALTCESYAFGAPAHLDCGHEDMVGYKYDEKYTAAHVARYAEDAGVAEALASWLNSPT